MRRFSWFVAGICAVVVVLVVGLKLYFTSDRLRGLVVPVLSEQLDRTVAARSLSLGLWGGVHVSVSGLRIADRAGFGTAPFVSVEEANLSVAFWPLLSGRVEIGEVALIRPEISVVIAQTGEANYADLVAEEEEPAQTGAGQPVRLDRVRIADGAVTYADRKAGKVLQLGGISYRLEMAVDGAEQSLAGDLVVQQVRWQQAGQVDTLDTGTLRLTHRVKSAGDAWVVEALELGWGPLAITASGRVRSAQDGMHLDLTVHEPRLDLGSKQLRDLTGMEMGLSGFASVQIAIAGRLNPDVAPPVYPDVSATAALSGVSISGDAVPETVRVDTAAVVLRDGALSLATLTGEAFGGRFSGTGNVGPVWPPDASRGSKVRADFKADGFRIARMASGGLPDGVKADGTVSLSVRAAGSLDEKLNPVLRSGAYAVTGQVDLRDGTVQTPDLRVPVEALNATVVLASGDVVTLERFTARAGESDFSVHARVSGALGHLLHPDPKVRPSGRLEVSGKRMDMDALFVVPETLPTEGDQTSAVLPIVRTADGDATIAFDSVVSDSIKYSNFWMHASAKDGVVRVDSLRARTMGGTLTAQAELDAHNKTGPVAMRAKAAFKDIQANALLKDFVGWNIPLFGEMGTSVTVTGTMDSTLTVIARDLVADGEAWAAEGRLVNWPFLKKSASFVPQLNFMDFSDLPLRSLHTLFRLEKERVSMKDTNFKTGDVGVGLSGSVGLDESLDVTVDADLPAARLSAKAAQFGLDRIPGVKLDENTRIPLQIRIGGTATKPSIEAQLKPEVKNAMEEKKQELKDKAKDKAKGLLKSLF